MLLAYGLWRFARSPAHRLDGGGLGEAAGSGPVIISGPEATRKAQQITEVLGRRFAIATREAAWVGTMISWTSGHSMGIVLVKGLGEFNDAPQLRFLCANLVRNDGLS
jgi:hypothetical protein